MNKHTQIITILKQPSTIAGILGLIGVILTAFGKELTPEMESAISTVLLTIVSLVAIIVQPKPENGVYTSEEYRPGNKWVRPDGVVFKMGEDGFWQEQEPGEGK